MSKIRIATCSCNLVTLRCSGDPASTIPFQCLQNQLRTGSVFGVQVGFHTRQLRSDGDILTYTRLYDDGSRIIFHFCPRCGDTMLLKTDSAPDYVIVPLGLFSELDFPVHGVSTYEETSGGWIKFDSEMDQFA
ncbi:aldehyde-activating protein [Vibrio sp. HA2012]|uniref:GFA family protein n=1 Tax=Vibrio sp. HA2012 TaxID=1971595 RepID=UPI000C2C0170|nr:GFA family protein [Vibrio sp. HA2012]PJC86735.1 aldehyde-activating protein [Vibrio sp. HA2012]